MAERTRGTVLVWVVAALLAAVGLWRLTGTAGDHSAGSPVRIDGSAGGASGGYAGGDDADGRRPGGGAEIYVHVAGAVRRPGLFRLPGGARVAVAIERAGGPTRKADLALVNLAARLEDGQQVLVPAAGAAAAAAAAAGAAASAGAAGGGAGAAGAGPGAAGTVKPSLASVTVEQLDQVDGIGPTLAQRIVDYRTEHGGFSSIGELREVEGIGEKRFESLRDALQP